MSASLESHLEEFLSRLEKASKEAVDAQITALAQQASPAAPIDSGDLRASLLQTESEEDDGSYTGAVGSPLPYAVKQHEDLSLNHPRGGGAKYLERPYLESKEAIQQGLANAIQAVSNGSP
ncbi:HK97 gp10 family phage protein [Meiothermus granaticius]|uniref:HK97 gp10 family phage protein n=1 Tax=Meiothermus granaticius NBRC 107808 TaxID=1227551 RepID=A0A399FCL7_9DEIN|nr:HK97 gp10 family phage protein [Meiothermus granaticius]RIH93990.1 hypothetical protein Mgrana_00076 [Meiothermus granaticius NBRC 107808]GEM88181.1 hypothetical protein MGR01S_28060 [Meiothermus granaticius NBRC 107808]